ncbi:MAG: AAA+ family ATPase, partial [Pseudanabaena sp. M165S2SP1A06QC]|nr:AAA+ family ATPase [Pseudanabaena sp. M165S2SP1A06QC]
EAYSQAQEILNKRGGSPRFNKNLLLFVAPDKNKLSPLEQSTAQYLAWKSITNECDILNLDPFQTKQADAKCQQFNESVDIQLKEAYQWALVPAQPDPQQGITWQEVRLQSQESPILKASRKLSHDNYFLTQYAAANMKLEALDPFLWRDVNHLEIKKLWSYLAQYLYLPKLRDEQVLLRAISEGVSSLLWRENFAYADAFDETQQRYVGLRGGEMSLLTNSTGLIVKPEIAQKQFDADEAKRKESATNKQTTDYQYTTSSQGITNIVKDGSSSTAKSNLRSENLPPPQPKRFYGSIKLNPLRCQRDMEQVTKEVLEHLMSLANAEVEITLDIQVRSQESISDTVIRTVTENCRTLKFDSQSFEQD